MCFDLYIFVQVLGVASTSNRCGTLQFQYAFGGSVAIPLLLIGQLWSCLQKPTTNPLNININPKISAPMDYR